MKVDAKTQGFRERHLIPKVLHYCFGMSHDFGGKPWSMVHYACVKSAIERIKPSNVLFYCEYEPTGPWWDRTRTMVTVEKVQAPREVFGNPILHGAHRADVLRLEKLSRAGGIYLDADVFVHRSFDPLLKHATVLGEERVDGNVVGLCNAVILAQPGAPFLEKWHSEYRRFRSRGNDDYWDEHSVRIPYQLSKKYPKEVTVLSHSAFFWPTFTENDLSRIYECVEPIDLSRAYATHLWESPAWGRYMEHLTPGRVRSVHSNFHYWIRPMIEGLPNNYGAPAFPARVANGVRRARRRARSIVHRWIAASKDFVSESARLSASAADIEKDDQRRGPR